MKLWQRRTLGVLALGGGTLGVALIAPALLAGGGLLKWIVGLTVIALYAWGMICGVRMLEAQPGAERANFYFWAAQVPMFASPWGSYFISSGLYAGALLQFAPYKLNVDARLGSAVNISLFADAPFALGINVAALVVAIWLWRVLRRDGRDSTPA